MPKVLILNIALLLLHPWFAGSIAWAQQDSAPASEQDRLVETEEGFSIGLAGGFQLGKRQDGYFLLGSRTVPGLVLVKPIASLTDAELRRGVETGYQDKSVQLAPDGDASDLEVEGGSAKIVEVRGSLFKTTVRGLLAGYLRPEGGGLLLFAVTAPQQWPTLEPVAREMARSLNLFRPDPAELIRIWTERLSGYQLTLASEAAADQAGVRSYSVCGDGTFLYEPAGGADAPNGPAGSWKIQVEGSRATLRFDFQDGRQKAYQLYREELETYLDNQRYFVVPGKRCQ